MVGLTNLKGRFHFIIIKDQADHPKTQKRMSLFADLAKEKGAEVDFVNLTGKTKMEKIFTNLLLGDWVTYYLALAYKIDPTPVKIVEDFKKRLAG
jgi:glucose/mannose-6-phosphate isomerase